MSTFASAADPVLARATTGSPSVPGVVAGVTDRNSMIFHGAAGKRTRGHDQPMTTDTIFAIFSCTKAITGTAIMQLVEDGRLDLDAPAANYVPDLARVQVLDGFDDAGEPRLRAPKRPVTTRHLMLHTAGFGYEIFNERVLKYAQATGQESVTTGKRAALSAPLLFDPGDAWEYGINIDWCGQIVEAITGQTLGEVMRQRIFVPCGMDDMSFTLTPDMRSRLAGMHARAPDGSVSVIEGFELPQSPEVQMGGHGLYGTVGDYCRFIRMYLNDGDGGFGRVLRPETIRLAETNGLGHLKIRMLPGVIKTLSNEAEFFPGLSKSWSLSFMVNDEAAPTGRPAGSLGWAGLANLFFWIDRQNGIAGFWATQMLPFADAASFGGFMGFETAIYEAQAAQRRAA